MRTQTRLLAAVGVVISCAAVPAAAAAAVPVSASAAVFGAGGIEPAPVAAASPGSGRQAVYGGKTRGEDPMVLWANAKGSEVTGATFTFTVRCPSGDSWPVYGDLAVRPAPKGMAIPLGVFLEQVNTARRFRLSLLADLRAGDPYGALLTMTLNGTRGARKASGTLDATVTITNTQTMELVEVCEPAPVKWTAERAPGRVFGGTTAQHEPVVVKLNAKRSKVSELRLGWYTNDCTDPNQFMNYGDALYDFRLRGRRFGDAFSQDFPRDDGGSNRWEYDISGKVAKTRASGSFAASVTYNEPGGSQVTCRLPATRWSAVSR